MLFRDKLVNVSTTWRMMETAYNMECSCEYFEWEVAYIR